MSRWDESHDPCGTVKSEYCVTISRDSSVPVTPIYRLTSRCSETRDNCHKHTHVMDHQVHVCGQ